MSPDEMRVMFFRTVLENDASMHMCSTSIHDLSHHSRLPSASGAESDVSGRSTALGGAAVRHERHAPRCGTPGDAARDDAVDATLGLAVQAAGGWPFFRGGRGQRRARGVRRRGCIDAAMSVAVSAIERFYLGRVLAPVRFSRRALSVTLCVAGGQAAAPSAAARQCRPGGGAIGGGRRRARRERAPVVGYAARALGGA